MQCFPQLLNSLSSYQADMIPKCVLQRGESCSICFYELVNSDHHALETFTNSHF